MPFIDEAWASAEPYITVEDLLEAPCACNYDPLDVTVLEKADLAVRDASNILYLLSGREVLGYRTEHIRPRRSGACTCTSQLGQLGGPYTTKLCPASVVLLEYPTHEVVQVQIDGVDVDGADYTIIDYRKLVYMRDADGNVRHWPADPKFDVGEDDLGAFMIEVVWGTPLPTWAHLAAIELACQYLKLHMGEEPDIKGVRSVSAGGASYSYREQADAVRESIAKLPRVAEFVSIVNPLGQPVGSAIWSPDVHVGGVRVT